MAKQIIRMAAPFVVEISTCGDLFDYAVTLWGALKAGGVRNGEFKSQRAAKAAARAAIKQLCEHQPPLI